METSESPATDGVQLTTEDKVEFSLRYLSGDVLNGRMPSSSTIGELRSKLEKEIPEISEFHTAKLSTGGDFVVDNSLVRGVFTPGSEVQLVITQAPEKAITTLTTLVEAYGMNDTMVRRALEFLRDVDSIDDELSEKVLSVAGNFFDKVDRYESEDPLLSEHIWEHVVRFGEAFGRSCRDPMPFIRKLLVMADERQRYRNHLNISFAMTALNEIDKKHGTALQGFADEMAPIVLNSLLVFGGYTQDMAQMVSAMYRLIGKFGDTDAVANCKRRLVCNQFSAQAEEALQQGMEARLQLQRPERDEPNGAAVVAVAPRAVGSATAVPEEEDATEQGLDEALVKSEATAVMDQNAHVQRALLDSLGAAVDSAPADSDIYIKIVVSQYSHGSEWLRHALMDGPELEEERRELLEAGFSPTLPSAAKIFVPPGVFETVVQHLDKIGLESKSSHVIFTANLQDKIEAVVEAARASTTRRERGSAKKRCQTDLRVAARNLDSRTSAEPDDDAPDYILKNSFVDVPLVTPNSLRSASSFRLPTV